VDAMIKAARLFQKNHIPVYKIDGNQLGIMHKNPQGKEHVMWVQVQNSAHVEGRYKIHTPSWIYEHHPYFEKVIALVGVYD